MKTYRVAALALMSWTLVITEPSLHTLKTGLPTREACEKAANNWREIYKRQVKQANATTYPNRRRRIAKAIPPTKCVEDTKTPLPPS